MAPVSSPTAAGPDHAPDPAPRRITLPVATGLVIGTMIGSGIFTLPASLAGLPGMSVPCGFGEHGLPVGLQLIGNYWQEAQLLHTAHAFQQATDWHLRAPAALG